MFASAQVAECATVARAAAFDALAEDRQHQRAESSLETAFQPVGGVATAEEIALLLRRHCDQPLSQLARWIVGRHVVHFERYGQTYLPLFQFNLEDMTVRREVGAVLDELAPALEPEEIGRWFVTPNTWLAGDSPVKRMASDVALVADAARADRFVTTGWV